MHAGWVRQLRASAAALGVLTGVSSCSAEFCDIVECTETGSGGSGGNPPTEGCAPVQGLAIPPTCGTFVEIGATGGSGSQDEPFGSITEAIDAGGVTIYVCGATTDEAVLLPGDSTMYGGIQCTGGWSFDLAARTELTAPAGSVPLSLGSGDESRVEGFTIRAKDAVAAGDSAIAVVVQATAARFARCELEAGDGQAGDAVAGGMGANGSMGGTGTASTGGSAGVSTCGSDGGKGGDYAVGAAANGDPGLGGSPAAVGGTGALASTTNPCTAGGTGTNGTVGVAGMDASGIGMLGAQGFEPPSATAGSTGIPGGGGGGGGARYQKAGGGGGSGGCGGVEGSAGGTGGSTIAIVSVGATLTFDACTATIGTAGNGALGGNGGPGGGAGPGGPGPSGTRAACSGGPGGTGGAGGRGGDGAGGHALIIAYSGALPNTTGLEFTTPTGSQAGSGAGLAADGEAADLLQFP